MQYRTPSSLAAFTALPAPARLPTRRILWWLYLGRLAVATAIFVAAVPAWLSASRADTLIASLLFAATMLFTAASALYTHVYRRSIALTILYAQAVFDLFLVTAVVHLTWGAGSSQFASLYILVIAVAALLLPARGVTLVSALAILLYTGEAALVRHDNGGVSVFLQLTVFAVVALGSGYIASRLRQEGAGREALAEELARFRLRESDIELLAMRAERLEAVAELGASMAHEIKNPLAAIRSAVEQISFFPRTSDDERVLTALVVRESDRLARLLSAFLDFARADVPCMRRLDVLDVARNAAELASAHPGRANGTTVVCDFPRAPLEVTGDEDMLHRAFFNLVLNALQASPDAGVVRIEAATLLPQQLDWRASAFESGAVALRIIDSGPGIPEESRSRLFHPFFSTKQNGNGLGLAIVHRAVEAHRGVVMVDSGSSGSSGATGARFTVLLPRN